MILQVAAEAVKSSSNLYLDGAAITALIGAGVLYLKTRRVRRNGNGNNRGLKPGAAPECVDHKEKLIRLDERWGDMKEDIVEMKGDVKTLLIRTMPKD